MPHCSALPLNVLFRVNAYITIGLHDWAWANPCNPDPPSCGTIDLTYQSQCGWRLPTSPNSSLTAWTSTILCARERTSTMPRVNNYARPQAQPSTTIAPPFRRPWRRRRRRGPFFHAPCITTRIGVEGYGQLLGRHLSRGGWRRHLGDPRRGITGAGTCYLRIMSLASQAFADGCVRGRRVVPPPCGACPHSGRPADSPCR